MKTKRLLLPATALALVALAAVAAERPVDVVAWDNPTLTEEGNTISPGGIAAAEVQCGGATVRVTDTAQLQPGQTGRAPLGVACQGAGDGPLTITVRVENPEGDAGPRSDPSPAFQKAGERFFILVDGPGAPSSLRLE